MQPKPQANHRAHLVNTHLTDIDAYAAYWVNKRRYYRAFVQQSLFGEWELVKLWGGLQTRLGGMQVVPVPSKLQGSVALAKEARRRAARGYQPTSMGPRPPG